MMDGYSYGFPTRPTKQMVRIIFSIPYRLFIEQEKIERVVRIIWNGKTRHGLDRVKSWTFMNT